MKRRTVVAPVLADGDELLMPRWLAYYNPDDGATVREHRRAQAAWLRAHGVDASDWYQVSPVLRASKRAHARTRAELAATRTRRLIVTGDAGTS